MKVHVNLANLPGIFQQSWNPVTFIHLLEEYEWSCVIVTDCDKKIKNLKYPTFSDHKSDCSNIG